MKRINIWLQNLQPLKIFSIFLAVIFLFLAQACNRSSIVGEPPQLPAKPPNVKIYDPTNDPTKDYPIAPYQGEMNNSSDVDAREREAEKAARYRGNEVIENSQINQENKEINSNDQYIHNFREEPPFRERLENLGEDVGNSTEELKEGSSKGTQRGIENLQENMERGVKDLTRNLQSGIEDMGRNIQRRVKDRGEPINSTLRQADSN